MLNAARRADLYAVRNWLEDESDGVRDVDDVGSSQLQSHGASWTLLMSCSNGTDDFEITSAHVDLARYLLSRGATVDVRNHFGYTALLYTCYRGGAAQPEMVSLLLSAGANPNVKHCSSQTPLCAYVETAYSPSLDVVTALLRAGASLELRYEDGFSIDDYLRERLRDNEERYLPRIDGGTYDAIKVIFAGVRRAGSFKSYCREPHREVLLLRGLAMRGHLMPRRRTRGTAEWTAAAAFLARLGDNGVVWNVLSFWRAAN